MEFSINIIDSGTSQAIETFHSKEYITFLSQVGFAHPGQMKIIFDQPDALSQVSPDLQSILIAGKAKIASLEGNFHLAQKYFEEAFLLAQKELKKNSTSTSRTSLAYVYYEYGLFYRILLSNDQAYDQFKQAYQLTSAIKLKYLIEYQLEFLSVEKGEKDNLNRLIRMVERFKKEKLIAAHILGLQNLGSLNKKRRKLDQADQYYREALYLAEQNDLQYLIWGIKNSIGLLLHKQKKFKASVSYFESFIDTVESHYLKAIVIKSLAIRYHLYGEKEKAIDLSKDGLEYAQMHNVFSMIPTYADLIGDLIIDHSSTPQEAFHYYKLGYEESMRQQEAGLPLTGTRLRAIKRYTEYLTSQLPESFHNITVANYFEWAKGKSWVRVQDLFHYNFFVYHFIHTGIGNKTFKHLDMISTTFYSLAKRMRDMRGIKFPNLKDADMVLPPDLYFDSLQKYVQLHRDKTFKQANAQFEHDIYEYLFKESGYNKKRLARSLDLSYSVVIKNTKQFTEASETFSQPQLEAPR